MRIATKLIGRAMQAALIGIVGLTASGACFAQVGSVSRFATIQTANGLCLDIPSYAWGATLTQVSCHGRDNQLFQFEMTRYELGWFSFRIRNLATGQCIDRPNNNLARQTRVQQWPCNGNAAQNWHVQAAYFSGSNQWHTWASNRWSPITCLDVPGNWRTEGLGLSLWDCNPFQPYSNPAQMFWFHGWD